MNAPASNTATMDKVPVCIYTDGACRGNPGPGGWGVTLSKGTNRLELHGGEADTTNNRMELTAAIKGLQALKRPGREVILFTDSKYLAKGMSEWLPAWKAKGWKTAGRKPVKNQDLWEELDRLAALHSIEWRWVEAHAGNPGNERADTLANMGIDALPGLS